MPSNSQLRHTAWRTVDAIIYHMRENEVITEEDLYMDLREELADIVMALSALRNPPLTRDEFTPHNS